MKESPDKEQYTEDSAKALSGWGSSKCLFVFSNSSSVLFLLCGSSGCGTCLPRRLRLRDGHESKVENDSARILGKRARNVWNVSILNWTIGPHDVHLGGSQVGVLASLVLIGDEGAHETDFEVGGIIFEIELSQDGSHIGDILVLSEVERTILILTILTDESVCGWIREIIWANGDIRIFNLVRAITKTHPEAWVIRGPVRDVVIFHNQSGIEVIWQGVFILEYSILDWVWTGIDWSTLERLGATRNILNVFLTLGVLQKPSGGNNCDESAFLKHV